MKKLRIISLILLCALLALSLTACFVKHIEDTNGDDDFSLVTITDEDLALNRKNSYISVGSTKTVTGNRTSLTINKFSGVYELEKFDVTNEIVTITVKMSVTSGNCRLVIVCNAQIVHDFDIQGTDTFVIEGAGEYCLKLAGESAKLSIEYTTVTE